MTSHEQEDCSETDSEIDEMCSYLSTPLEKTEPLAKQKEYRSILGTVPVIQLEKIDSQTVNANVNKPSNASVNSNENDPIGTNSSIYLSAYEQSILYKKETVRSRPPTMRSSKVHTSESVDKEMSNLSDDTDESNHGSGKKNICVNRAAIQARNNREKKKKYINTLEQTVGELKLENFDIKAKFMAKSKLCETLEKEVKYLRNVLANQSCISALLKNIQTTPDVVFTSSLLKPNNDSTDKGKENMQNSKKRSVDENDNYDSSSKGVYVRATGSHKRSRPESDQASSSFNPPLTPCPSPEQDNAGGICLHVSNNKVSIEMCSHCAESASDAWMRAAKLDVKAKTV